MARIKIKDLPKDTAISNEELKRIMGGSITDAALIVMSVASADMMGDLQNAAAQINVMHSVMNQYNSMRKRVGDMISGLGEPGDDEGGSIL